MAYYPHLKVLLPELRRRKDTPKKKCTQKTVAEYLGIGLRHYQKIEQTGNITLDIAGKLAAYHNIKVSELLGEKNAEPEPPGEGRRLRKIPILNHIPASGFALSFDQSPTDDWTYTDNLTDEGMFALRVWGDSMSPRMEDGDIVIVSPNRDFENNRIYAVVIEGDEHTLKTVSKADGGYMLIPFNTPKYPPMFIKDKQMVKLYRVVAMQKVL